MNILFSTGHPAQIHNFRNLKTELEKSGHNIFWIATDKDISRYLLNCYGINYVLLFRPGKSITSKIVTLIRNTFFSVRFIRKNKIDLALSRVSPYISLACFFTAKTHFALTDTETVRTYDKIFGRFASVLFTAESYKYKLRRDQIRFKGNIELFYLHPDRFKPSGDALSLLGILPGTPYIIMRFVSWEAFHDKGLTGFTNENKQKAVKEFSKFGNVFISAENPLPESLEPLRVKVPYEKMHDILADAKLFFGESATMASESAVLGTPAVFLNDNWFGSTDDEKEYGLLFCYKGNESDQKKAIEKGIELLADQDLNEKMIKNRDAFLKDKIDVTAFFVWFIGNWPESYKIMKKNPDYQNRFK